MGIVRMGPPEGLVLSLRDVLGARTFVETGTYGGATAAWAASHFDRVVTIEAVPEIRDQAIAKHGALANVEFILGDSRDVLPTLMRTVSGPAVFWLDGHWSGGITYREGGECPLLDELPLVLATQGSHAVLIDDARLFLCAPPQPHDPAEWPSIDRVVEALLAQAIRPVIAVVEDVIVAAPPIAGEALVAYCQESSTRAWNATEPAQPGYATRLAARVRAAVARG
jgi:hypothetical protein